MRILKPYATEVKRIALLDFNSENTTFNIRIRLKLLKLINLVLPEVAMFIRNPNIQAKLTCFFKLIQLFYQCYHFQKFCYPFPPHDGASRSKQPVFGGRTWRDSALINFH